MGGPKNSSGGKPVLFLSLKAKADEQNKPYFVQAEKKESGWALTNEFDTLEGMLSGAKIEEKDMKEYGKKNFFVLYIEFDEGVMKVDMSHNAVTYSIINSLASCANKLNNFSIAVYRTKNVSEKDGKTYYNGRAAVKMEGEKTEWFMNPQDAPKKVALMTKSKGKDVPMLKDGKQMYDDSELREHWETVFTEQVIGKIGSGKTASAGSGDQGSGATETFTASTQEDDLPF